MAINKSQKIQFSWNIYNLRMIYKKCFRGGKLIRRLLFYPWYPYSSAATTAQTNKPHIHGLRNEYWVAIHGVWSTFRTSWQESCNKSAVCLWNVSPQDFYFLGDVYLGRKKYLSEVYKRIKSLRIMYFYKRVRKKRLFGKVR